MTTEPRTATPRSAREARPLTVEEERLYLQDHDGRTCDYAWEICGGHHVLYDRAQARLLAAITPADGALDVERVKRAVVNIAVRHGLAKDPPIPLSVARIWGYSKAPIEMDAEIVAEYVRLSRADAPGTGTEGADR